MALCKAINGYVKAGDIITVDGYVNYKGEVQEYTNGGMLFKVMGTGEYEGKPQLLYKAVDHNTLKLKYKFSKKMNPNYELFEHANKTVTIIKKASLIESFKTIFFSK